MEAPPSHPASWAYRLTARPTPSPSARARPSASTGEGVPEVLGPGLQSMLALAANEKMVDGAAVKGLKVRGLIDGLLARPEVSDADASNAVRGCYAGRIERAA